MRRNRYTSNLTDGHGEEHRPVLSTLAETDNNDGQLGEVLFWVAADMVHACPEIRAPGGRNGCRCTMSAQLASCTRPRTFAESYHTTVRSRRHAI